jgi:hypothetical protein
MAAARRVKGVTVLELLVATNPRGVWPGGSNPAGSVKRFSRPGSKWKYAIGGTKFVSMKWT